MKRRDVLAAPALGLLGLRAGAALASDGIARAIDLAALQAAPTRVVTADGSVATDVRVDRKVASEGRHALVSGQVTNTGKQPVRVREVVIASLAHAMAQRTAIYGESTQMLSQTAGTLAAPVVLGYDERKHYKVPQPEGVAQAHTGMLVLEPPDGPVTLLGFASCQRFIGRFYLRAADGRGPATLDVVLEAEGLTLAPGESWPLERLFFAQGPARAPLQAQLAAEINKAHKPLAFARPPTGWCSWYCFGAKVTAGDVTSNLDVIAKDVPALKYVQVDDGYQPNMGDWLDTGKAFGGDVKGVLAAIKKRGFEPAIWVAPFIAEAGSKVFAQHPSWFIQGDDGKPLPADRVTFGGWRRGPWYALDGTHPEVQRHFERVFTTMRKQWGCTYFKLDANWWGTMHGGRFHDRKATRVEAYRRGMAAILRGTGDAFVLGCNHPIWPSFGLVHGSRSSGDVKRTWARFKKIARENLSRNWQNGTLWWNDSDAVCLTGELSEDEFRFHATAVYASGGMILSGDDLTKITPARLAMLKKLLPPTGRAAVFDDASLRVGRIELPDARRICVFNEEDRPQSINVALGGAAQVVDFWTGEKLGRHDKTLVCKDMPPHSARLFTLLPA